MNVMQLLLKRYKRNINKVIKGGNILSILFALIISLVIPPFNIYGQSLTSPFLGINVQVTAYGQNINSITLPKINIGYLSGTVPSGYISGQLNCTNPSTPTSTQPCDIFSFQNSSGTGGASNGTRIYLNLQQYVLEANGNATINDVDYYFIDYEFILDDDYRGSVTFTDGGNQSTFFVNGNKFHYSRIQNDMNEHTITIDNYSLVRITNGADWIFPVESLPFISSFMYYNKSKLVDYYGMGQYTFPIYQLGANDVIYNISSGVDKFRVVMFIASNVAYNLQYIKDQIIDFGTLSDYVDNFKYWGNTRIWQNGQTGYFVRFDITIPSYTTQVIKSRVDMQYIPIYLGSIKKMYVTSDFADQFGLYTYIESSDDLYDEKSDFDTTSNNLYTSENAFNTDMNNKLQSIDTSFNPSTSFGSKFLSSADWVRTQFNNLTSTSPFGTVLSFSMLLGLSLLIIGKVFK